MKKQHTKSPLSRRHLLSLAASGLAASLLPLKGWADDDDDDDDDHGAQDQSGGTSNTVPGTSPALMGKRVVVVGGGMAGMTAAKYLRLWGGSGLVVTLVEPDAQYTSSIMSNLVLTGGRTLSSLQYSRASLVSKYGVVLHRGSVVAVNVAARTVRLSDGSSLPYDRLVLAPGVSFDAAHGLTQADYDARTPHAWRAGAQTGLLRDQVAAMRNGDTFVMTIPKAPYRCPPGPYERACVVADYLKRTKGPASRVLVLDHNLTIQAEAHTFNTAFTQTHAGIIQYVAGVSNVGIDATTKVVTYVDQLGATQGVQARVVNPIVAHRATGSEPGGWLAAAGLNNGPEGRWANVDLLSYASTAAGAGDIHVIGDAANTGMPKAGHVANQEAKICTDAILRLLAGTAPDPQPVANSACFSPITATTASWLTAVYQYDPASARMKIAAQGGQTTVNGVPATATEAASASTENFKDMGVWFTTLMSDTAA